MKYNRAIEQAEAEYMKACEQERDITTTLEQEERKILNLKTECTILKKDLQEAKNQCIQCNLQIDIITKKYLERRKIYLKVGERMAQKKSECENILKECKVREFLK